MAKRHFKPGDRVIVNRKKHNTRPARRAHNVLPAANGDDYTYYVEKFWVVTDVLPDGQLMLQTPRGRKHLIDSDDPNLRPASWLEKVLYRHRFQRSETVAGTV